MPDRGNAEQTPLGLPSSSSVTLGELNRNIHALRDDLRSTRLELATVHKLSTAVELARTRIDALDQRVDELEGGVTWLVRLVLGALVLALLGVVLVAGSGAS